TGYGNDAVAVEAKGRADHSDFESGLVFGVVHQTVGQTEGQTVHRSGGRYPDMPVASPPREILYGALHTWFDDLDGVGQVLETVQEARSVTTTAEYRAVQDLFEIVHIGFDAVERGRVECGDQVRDGLFTICRMHDDLGQHRIIERRYLDAASHPGFDACRRREFHGRQRSGGRLKIFSGILCIHARVKGMTARRDRE